MVLKSMSFSLTVPNCTSNGGIDFFLQSPEFYRCRHEKIGLLILLKCEAASLTVFIAMCPKEQQTMQYVKIKLMQNETNRWSIFW